VRVKILVIEDDPTDQERLHDLLREAYPGCAITVCSSIRDGMLAVQKDRYDLATLDLVLADSTWPDETLAAAQPIIAAVPTIVISGVDPKITAKTQIAGVQSVLEKENMSVATLKTFIALATLKKDVDEAVAMCDLGLADAAAARTKAESLNTNVFGTPNGGNHADGQADGRGAVPVDPPDHRG
jgi:CheY-like chemotaxis protein